MARVVLEHLTRIFPGPNGASIRAVDDVSLTLEERELLVLLGPSGCGKTTTLRLVAGLEEPTAGTICIDGAVVNRVPPQQREIAMVFQNPALYPHLTVYENLAFGLKLRGCPKAEIGRRVGEAAELLGLADCLERKPMALSGGQRQRVAIGRALVRRARVYLFDEPLSHLDPPLRAQMRVELARLQAQLGATMLYVTHDQAEAMALGGRIAVMNAGGIRQVGAPLELYHHPANLFVAGFLGSPPMNLFAGTVLRREDGWCFQAETRPGAGGHNALDFRVGGNLVPRLSGFEGKQVVLGIRPETIALGGASPGTSPGQTAEAMVERVEALGAETYIHLSCAGHRFIARASAVEPVRAGQKVPLVLDLGQAHVFDPMTGRALV